MIVAKALFTAETGAVLVSLYYKIMIVIKVTLSAKSEMNCLSFYCLMFFPSNMHKYSTVFMASMNTKALESSSIYYCIMKSITYMSNYIEYLSIVFIQALLFPLYQFLKLSIENFHAFLFNIYLCQIWDLVEVVRH